MAFDVALLVGGIALLVVSADRMVLATAGLAERWGLSPLIIGALIIGFGSSLPEMLVSVLALDQPNGLDLAIGNVVGSNIANISVVLGVSVLLYPIAGHAKVVEREGVLMLGALVAVSVVLWDHELSWPEGALLVVGLLVAGFAVIRLSKSSPPVVEPPEQSEDKSVRRLLVEAIVGLVALIVAARAMVLGAESIAIELGLAEGVVGLTILALGTSLPELGAALASARRGHGDLVVGNVLGSNIFNAFGVAGVTGMVGPGALTAGFRGALVVMVLVGVLVGIIAWSGDRMRRLEGGLLVVAYPVAVVLAL